MILRVTMLLLVAAGVATVIGRPAAAAHTGVIVIGPAGQLYVDDGGAGGVPVVFLHSFAGSTAHWANQLDHLRTTRRALAIDFRGHGRSAPPARGDWAVGSLAADVAAVADHLKLDRFVLVGHSLGGAVAIAYAASHPERVAGLLLVGTPGRTPPERARQIMASLDKDYDQTMNAYWAKLLERARPNVRMELERERERLDRNASRALIRATFDFDPLPPLARYRGPKLIVIPGDEDSADALHRQAPDVPSTRIANTSHWPHLDEPAAFDRVLDAFLADANR